jgi:short-subunit dehydrogenase
VQTRDLEQETILVREATDGLGKRVASDHTQRGATVLLHGRSRERLEATFEEVRKVTGREQPRYYLADLSSLEEVRELAGRIFSDDERLDVLVKSASIIAQERM